MAWFQVNGGPGSQMLWGLSKTVHAVLIRAPDDLSRHRSGFFREPVSKGPELVLANKTISLCLLRRQGPRIPASRTPAHLTRNPILKAKTSPEAP